MEKLGADEDSSYQCRSNDAAWCAGQWCLCTAVCQIRYSHWGLWHHSPFYQTLDVVQKVRTDKGVKNSQGGQRRSSVFCQKGTSCLLYSWEPVLSSRLPRRIVCSGPENTQGGASPDKKAIQKQRVIFVWITIKQHSRVMCQVRMHQRRTPGSLEAPRSEPMSRRIAWCWS